MRPLIATSRPKQPIATYQAPVGWPGTRHRARIPGIVGAGKQGQPRSVDQDRRASVGRRVAAAPGAGRGLLDLAALRFDGTMKARHKAVWPSTAGSSWRIMNSPVQETSVACGGRIDWRLRWAATSDLDGLHAVACQPAVYRYLFDGKAPATELILGKIEQGMVDAERVDVGLWVLEAPTVRYGGYVQIEPSQLSRSAELLYLLDPAYWGQGLATRMAWTAITGLSHAAH